MAQAYAGLVLDKSNVVSVMCGFLVPPDARFCHAPEHRSRGPRHAPRVLGWGGAAESLAHHEVVGKREKESEPWRGGTLLSGVHFHGLRCPQIMPRLKTQNKPAAK